MLAIITGTRPEIIKMFPILKQLDQEGIEYKYIHTGQHYDYSMSSLFFNEFGICQPDYKVTLTESIKDPSIQTSEIKTKIQHILKKETFSAVVVQGDTNSVLASSLAAYQHKIPVYHVEAGIRCFDNTMQEEINRIAVDKISDILFAPTLTSKQNLLNEKVKGKIFTVGNTIMDAIKIILENYEVKDKNLGKNIIPNSDNISDKFILVTLHRAENLASKEFIHDFFSALKESNLNYIFPAHPRTVKQIKYFGLESIFQNDKIRIIEPVGYRKFLNLLKRCRFVITDSGGIQEEVTSNLINKHAIIIRPNTERPESVQSGHSILLSDFNIEKLNTEIRVLNEKIEIENGRVISPSPYGLGNSAKEIVDIIKNQHTQIEVPNLT